MESYAVSYPGWSEGYENMYTNIPPQFLTATYIDPILMNYQSIPLPMEEFGYTQEQQLAINNNRKNLHKRKKKKLFGWWCKYCTYINFSKRKECQLCKRSIEECEKKGWWCDFCSYVNPEDIKECEKCSVPREKCERWRWRCDLCDYWNEMRLRKCAGCRFPREKSKNVPTRLPVWRCDSCEHDNFLLRNKCQICRLPREECDKKVWRCEGCNYVNYNTRQHCHICKKPRNQCEKIKFNDDASQLLDNAPPTKSVNTENEKTKTSDSKQRDFSQISSLRYGHKGDFRTKSNRFNYPYTTSPIILQKKMLISPRSDNTTDTPIILPPIHKLSLKMNQNPEQQQQNVLNIIRNNCLLKTRSDPSQFTSSDREYPTLPPTKEWDIPTTVISPSEDNTSLVVDSDKHENINENNKLHRSSTFPTLSKEDIPITIDNELIPEGNHCKRPNSNLPKNSKLNPTTPPFEIETFTHQSHNKNKNNDEKGVTTSRETTNGLFPNSKNNKWYCPSGLLDAINDDNNNKHVTFKCHFFNSIRLITFERSEISVQNLQFKIIQRFGLKQLIPSDIFLLYKDEDGDRITIANDDDLDDLMKHAGNKQKNKFVFYIQVGKMTYDNMMV